MHKNDLPQAVIRTLFKAKYAQWTRSALFSAVVVFIVASLYNMLYSFNSSEFLPPAVSIDDR